jgi:hypothetical protein
MCLYAAHNHEFPTSGHNSNYAVYIELMIV